MTDLLLTSAETFADWSKRRKKDKKMIGNQFPFMTESKNKMTIFLQTNSMEVINLPLW